MATIEAQLDLERHMLNRGAEIYDLSVAKAEEHGRGSETQYAQRLMREFLLPLVEALDEYVNQKTAGRQGKVRPMLRRVQSDRAMLITLQCLFNAFTFECDTAVLASAIGRRIEDEVRFSRFAEMHQDYYDAIRTDFKRKGTKDYRFMHRVLTHKANEMQDQWIEWTPAERIQVGVALLDIILTNTDLITKHEYRQKGKTHVSIVPTESTMQWIKEHNDKVRFLFPDKMPCIIPPDPWTSNSQGGYYSPELRSTTHMVKTSSKRHRKVVESADLGLVREALNHLQSTAWEVNAEVLDIVRTVWARNLQVGMPGSQPMKPRPSPFVDRDKGSLTDAEMESLEDWKREAAEIYTAEKKRVAQAFQTTRIIRLANEFSQHASFWFVWYADFRGRCYTTTAGFSPQGPDIAKGLLRFREGKRLGDRGWYWLRVHIANKFGYDKVSYDDRVAWVDERSRAIVATANDPLSHRNVWGDADKPYQFLAAIFEYRDALALTELGLSPTDFVSKLAVGLDGSCNGLQNFSAMLRDEVGGAATNLVPGAKPNDIYQQVADVCSEKIPHLIDDPVGRGWRDLLVKHFNGRMSRKLPKRPVMTLPYGATRQSCTKYIFEELIKLDNEHFPAAGLRDSEDKPVGNFRAACWLTPHLWDSISEVVKAAPIAMSWLQRVASAVNKTGEPVIWTTADGFIAYQGARVIETHKVETKLGGRFQIRVGTFLDKFDPHKQRNGISPNFVHSQDATHMRETIRRAKALGISSLSMIHDDYGTHAADTDTLHQVLREAFVHLYTTHDPLGEFKSEQELRTGVKLEPVPAHGSLDIQGVLKSPYFFG